MDGLLFLSSLIAIGLLMVWVVMNDHAKPDGRTTGLFAIRWRPRAGAANRSSGAAANADAPRRRRSRSVLSRRFR